jgi:tRNA threonylcarbamoyladenosine biosynthesis protein TsaE
MSTKSDKKILIQSASESRTIAIGEALGRALKPGMIVALTGELGSGKTRLVKGIARGLGFMDDTLVTSPTFKLLNVYDGRQKIYHVDAYRIFNRKTLEENYSDLYIDEASASGGVVVVEWADRLRPLLKGDIEVEISITGGRTRELAIGGRAVAECADALKGFIRSASSAGRSKAKRKAGR